MEKSLKNFNVSFQEQLLKFLWRQWSSLGVAGYGSVEDWRAIDPEALLLLSCSIARYDARLFDEILDWLDVNSELMNIQRIKTILKDEEFSGSNVFSAIASLMSSRKKFSKWSTAEKWERNRTDVKMESLFFEIDGQPLAMFGKPEEHFFKHGLARGKIIFRKHSQLLRGNHLYTILFKLRLLFGITARSEIILYLLSHDSAHPSEIARQTYYSQKTVQDTLVEMSKSGMIFVRPVGKEKHYWVKAEEWMGFLGYDARERPQWVNWPKIFSAFDAISLKLNQKSFISLEPVMQASELRELMRKVRTRIESAGFAKALSDDKLYLGESYKNVFLSDINKLLE